MKFFKHLSTAALALSAGCFLSSIAAAADGSYAVSYLKYPQERSLWCWAACAQMSGRQANPNSTRTQSGIVQYVKGSIINQTASLSECEIAAEYATNNTIEYAAVTSVLSYEVLCTQMIFQKIPMCVWYTYDPPYAASIKGHMITIGAVDFGTTQDSRYVTYYDPSTNLTVRTSYSNFSFGDAEEPLIPDACRRWEETVYR